MTDDLTLTLTLTLTTRTLTLTLTLNPTLARTPSSHTMHTPHTTGHSRERRSAAEKCTSPNPGKGGGSTVVGGGGGGMEGT